jgi:nucleotide-binding universal stress UspA family protein
MEAVYDHAEHSFWTFQLKSAYCLNNGSRCLHTIQRIVMKTILIPFRDDDCSESALAAAHVIAQQHQSHIEGLFVAPEPPIISGVPIPDAYLIQMAEDREQRVIAARERFDACLQSANLRRADISDVEPGPSASWYKTKGVENQVIGERGRLFDLIVIGREQDHPGDWMNACEAALFDTGKPVLVAANQVEDTCGDNAVIAWNASAETARAVALGITLIANASQVTVLTMPGASVPGPDGAEFVAHLRRHGINATHDTIESAGGEEAGAATLEYVKATGATLLIKGAYTHTRLRQIVFGGATRYILNNADVPVLLAH